MDNGFKPQEQTKKYIENHIDLIENNAFEHLYTQADKEGIFARDITDILLAVGINPLYYMDHVPHSFARGSRRSMHGFIIPDGIKEIEGYAFSNTDIENITIPDGCTILRRGAFSGCPELNSIWIPESISEIHDMCFNGSDKVIIYYKGTAEMWAMVRKTNKWKGLNDSKIIMVACKDKIVTQGK